MSDIVDIAVIGAGPAGLTASIHGCFEGKTVALWEGHEVGGQSVTTSYIMNFSSYPLPVAGRTLIKRMTLQLEAYKDKYKLINDRVIHIDPRLDGYINVEGLTHTIIAKKVLLTCGLTFKRDNRIPAYHNVFYGPSVDMHPHFAHKDVCIIGGANSAGQAAIQLASHLAKVAIVTHHDSLDVTMSAELVELIKKLPIDILTNCEYKSISKLQNNILEVDFTSSEIVRTIHVNGLFICIGQEPDTLWLDSINKTKEGVIIVDENYKTSINNVYAAGDVIVQNGVHRVMAACGRASEAIACMIRE